MLRQLGRGLFAEGTKPEPLLTFEGVTPAIPLCGQILVDKLRKHPDLFGDETDQRRGRPLAGAQGAAGIVEIAEHEPIAETIGIAPAAQNRREVGRRQREVTDQLTLLDGWVKPVMKQARARIFDGDTRSEGKLLSLFEPSTEVIRKGKAAKPNEFGKMLKLQEAENQIVTDYEVYDRRPNDADLLIPAIETHQARLGRAPYLVAADAAFYSGKNEAAAKAKGVKRVCIPNRSTKSLERKREQKKRWFRKGQKWRTGSEGRISVVKRRHGLDRCRYKGDSGMRRWVGLGVIGDNLIAIGNAMEKKSDP